MSDYDNTIVLFKNDKWEEGGKQPIYKGLAEFNGTKLNCSVWLKEAKGDGKLPAGTKFLSGVFDDWQPPASQQAATNSVPEKDDIPF